MFSEKKGPGSPRVDMFTFCKSLGARLAFKVLFPQTFIKSEACLHFIAAWMDI